MAMDSLYAAVIVRGPARTKVGVTRSRMAVLALFASLALGTGLTWGAGPSPAGGEARNRQFQCGLRVNFAVHSLCWP